MTKLLIKKEKKKKLTLLLCNLIDSVFDEYNRHRCVVCTRAFKNGPTVQKLTVSFFSLPDKEQETRAREILRRIKLCAAN